MKEDISNEETGVKPRLHDVETNVSDIIERIDTLEEKNRELHEQVHLLRGTIHVHDNKISSNQNKVFNLTMRSMAKNVIITGITGDVPEEDNAQCKQKVVKLLNDKMKMDVEDAQVIVAHRMGTKQKDKNRGIVVKCVPKLRSTIFQHTSTLKNITNEFGQPYYINSQTPEPRTTQHKEMFQKITEVRKTNEAITDVAKKTKIEIKRGQLYLNGKLQKQHIFPPTVAKILNVDATMQAKLDAIKPAISSTYTEKSSEFTGYAVRAFNTTDTKLEYTKIKQMVPEADHIMMSYSFKHHEGYHDYGEHGSGKRLLDLLHTRNLHNVVVFVTRVYGGIPIGPKRLLLIEKAARGALESLE